MHRSRTGSAPLPSPFADPRLAAPRPGQARAATADDPSAAVGPTHAERARRLQAAYDASAHDAGQRLLLRELMAHYRAWCLSQSIADPFLRAPEVRVSRLPRPRPDVLAPEEPVLDDLTLARRGRRPPVAPPTAPIARAAG